MATPFIPLTETFFVAPQITAEDLDAARASGVSLIINNRPDHEEPGQPLGATIEAAAKALGLDYVAVPVGAAGISERDLDAFDEAIAATSGAVLAYCRSGTRSTILRAMARARAGTPIDALIQEAANAGYNLEGHRPLLEAARSND
ncbi:MAG: TIGR01244 family sulfur transferase [Pseudomonadota bacterium]